MATLWSGPLEMEAHVSAFSWPTGQPRRRHLQRTDQTTQMPRCKGRSDIFHMSIKSYSLLPIGRHPILNPLTPWKQYICYFVTLYSEFSRHQPASGTQCLWNTQLGKPFRNKEILITTHTLKAPGRCLWHVRMINKLTAAHAIRKLPGQITN